MGNQHSSQLRLKPHQLRQKLVGSGRSKSSASANNADEQGTAFVCHANGVLIGKAQFKCTFCSTIKRSAVALRIHYDKRHNLNESGSDCAVNTCNDQHVTTQQHESINRFNQSNSIDHAQSKTELEIDSVAPTNTKNDQQSAEDVSNRLRPRSLYSQEGGTVLQLLNQYNHMENESSKEEHSSSTNQLKTGQSSVNLNLAMHSNASSSTLGRLTLFVQDRDLIVRCASTDYNRFDLLPIDSLAQSNDQSLIDSSQPSTFIVELARLREQLSKLNRTSRLNLMLIDPDNASLDLNNLHANSLNETNTSIDSLRKRAIERRKLKLKGSTCSDEDEDDSEDELLNEETESQVHVTTHNETDSNCPIDSLDQAVDLNDASLDANLTQASDARCAVCSAHNYVVCIQRRLGKPICANCFRFFRHFLSNPIAYACHQLGKCDLTKPVRSKCSSESAHSSHTSTAQPAPESPVKHVVKQQQLGMLGKSSCKTSNSSNKPIGLKHFNLTSSNQSPDRLSLATSGSFTQTERCPSSASSNHANACVGLVGGRTSTSKRLFSSVNASNHNNIDKDSIRCNACWLKKCVDVYIEVNFDEHIMQVLNDFRPIQLPPMHYNRSGKPPIGNRSNRLYSAPKSKSMSRLFHESENGSIANDSGSISWRPSSTNRSISTSSAIVSVSKNAQANHTNQSNKSATLGRNRSYTSKSVTLGPLDLIQKLPRARDSYADSGHCASNDSATNSVDLDRTISPDQLNEDNRPKSVDSLQRSPSLSATFDARSTLISSSTPVVKSTPTFASFNKPPTPSNSTSLSSTLPPPPPPPPRRIHLQSSSSEGQTRSNNRTSKQTPVLSLFEDQQTTSSSATNSPSPQPPPSTSSSSSSPQPLLTISNPSRLDHVLPQHSLPMIHS